MFPYLLGQELRHFAIDLYPRRQSPTSAPHGATPVVLLIQQDHLLIGGVGTVGPKEHGFGHQNDMRSSPRSAAVWAAWKRGHLCPLCGKESKG